MEFLWLNGINLSMGKEILVREWITLKQGHTYPVDSISAGPDWFGPQKRQSPVPWFNNNTCQNSAIFVWNAACRRSQHPGSTGSAPSCHSEVSTNRTFQTSVLVGGGCCHAVGGVRLPGVSAEQAVKGQRKPSKILRVGFRS